jgi:hypothetical protein
MPGHADRSRKRRDDALVFPRERNFCVFQLWRDGAYNARRDLILKVENVFETAVEAIRPKVSIRRNLY